MISRVKHRCKWLESALNDIIDQVNRQRPIQGNGITISVTDNGSLITAIPISSDSSNTSNSSTIPR